jgi:hypothetical protein
LHSEAEIRLAFVGEFLELIDASAGNAQRHRFVGMDKGKPGYRATANCDAHG